MEPNLTPDPTITSSKKWILPAAIVLAVIVIISLLYSLRPGQFTVISTNPTTDKVATTSPFFKVNFSQTLSRSGVSVSSDPAIINSYSVSDKTLTLTLNQNMTAGKNYTITINSISDNAGQRITNKQFSFTPVALDSSQLPQDQLNSTLQQQQVHPPSKDNITFVGTDTLTNYGVTLTQENDLEQAFFNYAPNSKGVVIDTTTIAPVARDPNSASPGDIINFTVAIDSQNYGASIYYSNITALKLTLTNPSTGKPVFDSGTIDVTQ